MSCLPVPFKSGGFPRGSTITVEGTVNGKAERDFTVDLLCPEGIAFRLKANFRQRTVVLNDNTDGNWGYEEKFPSMPFQPGRSFKLTIEAQQTGYSIDANTTTVFFKYRYGDLFKITQMKMDGDVSLTKVSNTY